MICFEATSSHVYMCVLAHYQAKTAMDKSNFGIAFLNPDVANRLCMASCGLDCAMRPEI